MKRLLLILAASNVGLFAQCSGYSVSINGTVAQVTASIVNFPVVVKLTDTRFKTLANGGDVNSGNGYDICFSDTGNTVSYPLWLISYDGTNGIINFRFKIPSLSSSSTTAFKVWLGNASVTMNQSSTTTFDSSFASIWPLTEATNPYIDVTANGKNSTSGTYPTQKTSGCALGLGDFCQTFAAASSQFITAPNGVTTGTQTTISSWVQVGSLTGSNLAIFDNRANGATDGCVLYLDSTAHGAFFCLNIGTVTAAAAINDGSWHHVAGVLCVGCGGITLYVDGVSQGNLATGGFSGFAAGNARIGSAYSNTAFWSGAMEEVRFSSAGRAAAWIAAESANMANPAGFVLIAGGGGSGTFTISPVAVPNNNAAPLALTLTGVGTSWASQTFTISGCGTKSSQVIDSATSVRLYITTNATVCTATVSDGTINSTVPIGPFGSGTGAIFVTSH